MNRYDTIIVGAGQAGLAMSNELTTRGIDHVVLERARIGERWRTERWDSLRMLTPNWMTRLPNLTGAPSDEDGYMSKDDVVDLLAGYASSFDAPVIEGVTVERIRRRSEGFTVETDAGNWSGRRVVLATGFCGAPSVPDASKAISPAIDQLHASAYKNPGALAPGAVLVVGAGASGLQIAAELRSSGRRVILASGRHARALRRYRGMDFWWWMDRIGSLDETIDDVADVRAARTAPSLGLTGAGGGRDIDLAILAEAGIEITGRLLDAGGSVVEFGDNLFLDVTKAEQRLRRLLGRFDEWADRHQLDTRLDPPAWPVPVRLPDPVRTMDLGARGVGTVVWATGYRPAYPAIDGAMFDPSGALIQRRGVTTVPGLYVLGIRFQWTRGSHFLGGVGRDAEYLGALIAGADRIPAIA